MCGLRISDSPTSDNVSPQETTKQDALKMGVDGSHLSCPGSSAVAEIKSFEVTQRGEFALAQDLPEVDQL
jgi:hypothetical protein